MWIEKTKQGNYKFVERYKSSLTGRYRRVSVTYGKKSPQVKKTATQELEKKITDELAAEGHAVKKATIKQLETAFLKDYKKRVRISTYVNGDVLLRGFIHEAGEDTLVTKITTIWLNRFFRSLLYDQKQTNGTVRAVKGKVNQFFTYATTYGYLKDNPMDDVRVEWKDESEHRQDEIENKYLTHKEYRTIIDDCLDRGVQYYADAFELQYLTGLRFGELAALQVNDIIRREGKTYLRVDGTMRYLEKPARHFISDTAKTFAGNRTIILSPAAVNIVEQHSARKDDDALLFAINQLATHYEDQRPLNINNANTMLKRIAKRHDLTKPISTHYFRHTHVSVLADMNVPLRVIQKRIGHSRSDITQKIYLHVTQQVQSDFEDRIADLDKYQ